MFGLSLNSRQEGRWEPGDPLRLCELSGRVPPEFSLHWRGLCSVMLLSQQRPATACFLVSASGPDDSALESSLSPPPSACSLLPEPAVQSCWPLSPVRLELLDLHPLPTKLFRCQKKQPYISWAPPHCGMGKWTA